MSGAGSDHAGRQKRQTWKLPAALTCLSGAARVVPRALVGARAPACLRRDLAKSSARPRRVERLCGWLKQATPLPLSLRGGPLTGTCLAELVRSEPEPTRVQAEHKERLSLPDWSAMRSNLPPGSPEALPAEGRARDEKHPRTRPAPPHPWGQQAQRQPMAPTQKRAAPFDQPVRAGYEFLARLTAAGKNAPLGGIGHRPAGAAPAAIAHGTAGLSRLRRLGAVRRGQKSPGRSPLPGAWRRRPAGAEANLVQAGGLASGVYESSLATPLGGPAAAYELLWRLAGDQRLLRRGLSAVELSSEQPSLLRSQAESSSSGFPEWDAPFSSAPWQAAPEPLAGPPTGSRQGFYPSAGSLPLPAAGQPGERPAVAPPLAADQPPTLLPPQAVYDAPTPFASASLRQQARQDESSLVQEDLDLLASKIKRILDEEARRHGIDV